MPEEVSRPGKRIAMWSGPRNISTALMRAWESRTDTAVVDEPFYAAYLQATGLEHPGREAILAAQPTDWTSVVRFLTGPIPDGREIFYQKLMAHHLLPDVERDWLNALTHCFLIRDPAEMLASLLSVWPAAKLNDTGLPQQLELIAWVNAQDRQPVIILDARDVLQQPRQMLIQLCQRLDVPFREEMLVWQPGPRESDGVWAEHWYQRVYESTTFEPYHPRSLQIPPGLESSYHELLPACEDMYQQLYAQRLRPEVV